MKKILFALVFFFSFFSISFAETYCGSGIVQFSASGSDLNLIKTGNFYMTLLNASQNNYYQGTKTHARGRNNGGTYLFGLYSSVYGADSNASTNLYTTQTGAVSLRVYNNGNNFTFYTSTGGVGFSGTMNGTHKNTFMNATDFIVQLYDMSTTGCLRFDSVPFSSESCMDGIKNQNETSIDYGGVCGTCTDGIQQLNVTNPEIYGVDYGGRCSSSVKLTGCTTQTLRYIGTNPTVYTIGSYTGYAEAITSSGQAEGNKKHDMLFYNPSNTNQYTGLSFVYGPLTTVNTGALFSTGSGWFGLKNAYNFNSIYGVDTQIGIVDYPGYTRSFNAVRLWVGTSYVIGKNADGSPMAPGYANFSSKTAGVSAKNYPLLFTGGYLYATFDRAGYDATDLLIYPITLPISFAGIQLVNSTQSGSFTSCGNGVYKCQWRLADPTRYECVPTYNASGTPQGTCTASGNTCMPATSTGYFDGAIGLPDGTFKPTYDASGATVGVDYTGVGSDIFTCTIRSGFDGIADALKCPLTVVSNIWNKITQFFSTLFGFFANFLKIGGSYSGSGTTNNTNLLGYIIPTASAAFTNSTEPSFLSGSNWKGTSTGLTRAILGSMDNFGTKTDAVHNVVITVYWALIFIVIISIIFFIFSMFS